jgi:transposase
MIQLIPQLHILLACQPVDFRCGIDGLAAVCRNHLNHNPMSGTLFVFRNRRGTALKMLCYDGVGYWMVTRRFSQGKLRYWPDQPDTPLHPMQAQELAVLLYQGLPDSARFAPAWRKLPPHSAQAARACAPDFA